MPAVREDGQGCEERISAAILVLSVSVANQYSLGPNKTEIELAHEQYLREFGESAGSEVLQRAAEADDSFGKKKWNNAKKAQRLAAGVNWARRESHVNEDEIDRLRGVVGTVSECSYESGYSLSSMLLGAATGRASITSRVNAAMTAAVSAAAFEQWQAARSAFTDCVESLRVLARFFEADETQLRSMEAHILRDWTALRKNLNPSEELLDLSKADAADFLLERVVWNTDFGGGNGGALAQTDAMARLVIRLEHWFEAQNGDAMPLATRWREVIFSTLRIPAGEELPGRVRCAVTCADSLLETGNYDAALHLYDRVLRLQEFAQGPLSAHARINHACALYGLNRRKEALDAFEGIDHTALKSLSELILTVEAEWARYLAVGCLLKPSGPEADRISAHDEVRQRVGHVGGMLVGSANGRTGYLRNLFVGQLVRDTEAILAMGSYRQSD